LEIIRLLALGVRALILDEPTTGISAEQKDTLFAALRDLARDEGMIVLLVSHKLEDVIALCDEVFVLRTGLKVGEMDMPLHDSPLSSQQIAETKAELVRMMFGELLKPEEREDIPLDDLNQIKLPALMLDHVHLNDKRLDMPDVSLKVRPGEVIGLAGLDGSGQELLMRACAGLHRVQSGRIFIGGEDVTNKPYRQLMVRGVVFGAAGRLEEGLIAGLTLTEHMALVTNGGRVVDWKGARKRTDSQIAQYDIRGRATDNIEQLSGGNQQRVLMALLPDKPRLMILEQPTRGLDVESARWIWKQLLERRQTGAAIVFSSAELDEIVTYSDRILVCYAGRVHLISDARQVTIDELGHLIGGEFGRT
jgi:simple sugar transport system ATP-binding protein